MIPNEAAGETDNQDILRTLTWLLKRSEENDTRNREILEQLSEQAEIIRNMQGVRLTGQARNPIGLYEERVEQQRAVQIEKLNSKNFRTWRRELELNMKEIGLWSAIIGEIKDAGTRWERRFTDKELDKAYHILYQSCDTTHKELIVHEPNPHEAWKIIQRLYNPENATSRLMAVREFFRIQMQPEESMDVFIRRFQQTYRDFVAAGHSELEDILVAQHLLLSLSEDYDYVRTVANTIKLSEFTPARIEELLISEAKQRSVSGKERRPSGDVFLAKSKSREVQQN
jgi:hypothetical protein